MKITSRLVIQTLIVIIFLGWFVSMWIANDRHNKNKDAAHKMKMDEIDARLKAEKDEKDALLRAENERVRNENIINEQYFNEHRDEIISSLKSAISIGNEQQVLIETKPYINIQDKELQAIIGAANRTMAKRAEENRIRNKKQRIIDELPAEELAWHADNTYGWDCKEVIYKGGMTPDNYFIMECSTGNKFRVFPRPGTYPVIKI